MEAPLNASATTAGALISNATFVVPPYQREYAWEEDEVSELWTDLRSAIADDSYFLGLVILTDEESRKHVVDGQQRMLTITLLAAALYHEAVRAGRSALADRIQADFLTAIDYTTDEKRVRVALSDPRDNATFQEILASPGELHLRRDPGDELLSGKLIRASSYLRRRLRDDLAPNSFKRLGDWTAFLTNRVYFAVFIHPNPSAAYRVFEVINTRGRELTTADLLKSYILSSTAPNQRSARYQAWQDISRSLESSGTGTLVQYIRHVTSLTAGHVPPRDLFD
jgi:uncharacterized protein with ParB-like and HNH nuclease domain